MPNFSKPIFDGSLGETRVVRFCRRAQPVQVGRLKKYDLIQMSKPVGSKIVDHPRMEQEDFKSTP